MVSKKSKAISLIKEGKYKKALKILKGFTREFTIDQSRHLQIAYETWSSCTTQAFYNAIDVNWSESQAISKQLMSMYAK